MSERVHMTAPDGRTFTFKEWCEYLKQPGHDVYSEYVGADGKVFEVDGFRFNVHGSCRNPHRIMVGDHEVGFELRTYRKWVSLKDRGVVWWCDIFGYGTTGAGGFGYVEGDETDAIIEGLRHAIRAMEYRAAWYERAIKAERESGQEWHMGYESSLARCRKGIALAREEYDKRVQLSLF